MVPSLCRITSNVNGPAGTEDDKVNRFNRNQYPSWIIPNFGQLGGSHCSEQPECVFITRDNVWRLIVGYDNYCETLNMVAPCVVYNVLHQTT